MTTRTQVDGLNELYSQDTGLDCSDLPDLARQEFKDETDVNIVLAKFGVGSMRQPEYGAVDYNMDLQIALESIREAERAIEKLPPELRTKYSTWERLLDGAYNGELKTDLGTYNELQASEKAAAEKAALDRAAAAAVPSREGQ